MIENRVHLRNKKEKSVKEKIELSSIRKLVTTKLREYNNRKENETIESILETGRSTSRFERY